MIICDHCHLKERDGDHPIRTYTFLMRPGIGSIQALSRDNIDLCETCLQIAVKQINKILDRKMLLSKEA